MFTVEQIKAAHSKVKSGADFPRYIQDIIQLGVTSYTTYVSDGHAEYQGKDNYTTSSPAKYAPLTIAEQSQPKEFKARLKAHQQGQSDYLTFCNECAQLGVDKWVVVMSEMTCTYYDKAGNELLVEVIPQ